MTRQVSRFLRSGLLAGGATIEASPADNVIAKTHACVPALGLPVDIVSRIWS